MHHSPGIFPLLSAKVRCSHSECCKREIVGWLLREKTVLLEAMLNDYHQFIVTGSGDERRQQPVVISPEPGTGKNIRQMRLCICFYFDYHV